MAISRLLLPKAGGPHFHRRGVFQSTNWYSFSSSSTDGSEKSSSLKGLEAAREGKAVDEKPKKESGTWFKGILTNVKHKILGNVEIQKPTAGGTSDSKADLTDSEVAMTESTSHETKLAESKSLPQLPEVVTTPPGVTEVVSSCSTSNKVRENAFEGPAVTKMHSIPGNSELGDFKSKLEPREAVIVSHGNDNDDLSTFLSDVVVGDSSSKINKSGNLSDVYMKMPKNEVKQFEEVMLDAPVHCDKKQSSPAEDLLGLTEELFGERCEKFPDDKSDLAFLEITNNVLRNKTKTSIQTPNASRSSAKNYTPSKSSSKARDLVNFIKREKNDALAGELPDELHDTLPTVEAPAGKKVEKNLEILNLIKSIKKLPKEQSTIKARERIFCNGTDQGSNIGLLRNVQSQVNRQNSDVKRRPTSMKHYMNGENKISSLKNGELNMDAEPKSNRTEGGSLNFANCDNIKSGWNYHVPLPDSRDEPYSSSQTCSSKERSGENKLLVRFLTRNSQKHHILAALSDCGPIVNVDEVSSTKGSIFKDFCVHFKTRTGCRNALKKNEHMILNREVFLEPFSSENMDNAISIPDLIGDPDAPVALVKNPTKTIKVTHLSEDISSQQLKRALAFCHSRVSSVFLGSTNSVRYVEFETEDAKERALAEHSLFISGKVLPILRIDAPRTTVVRISNVNTRSKVSTICKSQGEVRFVLLRSMDVMDVHYKLSEWPNMLNIVNSLNGLEMDDNRWVAQPAPVFPPAILHALWSQPEERRHLIAAVCCLLRKLEEPISKIYTSQLPELAAKYYGKEV